MKTRLVLNLVAVLWLLSAMLDIGAASAAESPGLPPTATEKTELDKLVGQPIKSVLVDGQPWTGFNKDKDVLELTGLTGKVAVVARY